MDVERARALAEQLLAEPLPRRWRHTQGVARQARAKAAELGDDAKLVEAAAWLHDIGYSPALAVTGFHPLDGARYLREVEHADAVVCDLVAHHTGAWFEADERGLLEPFTAEFGDEGTRPRLIRALTCCDLRTSPDGDPVSPEDRIAEILARYPVEDPVARAVRRSESHLLAMCE